MARNTLSLNKNKPATSAAAPHDFIDDTLDVTDAMEAKALADKLEAHLANGDDEDRAALAQLELRKFKPNVYTRQLTELAILNLCNEPSPKLDAAARDKAKFRKDLLEATGHDLPIACAIIAQTTDHRDAPGAIYSLCFNVVKAALFVANMHYRRALDPKADFDLEQFVDRREDEREAPYGLQRDSITFADDIVLLKAETFDDAPDNVILEGLRDVKLFCSLIAESFGWQSDEDMPYMFDAQPDGSFRPVFDAETALDMSEVKRLAARARREAEQAEQRRKTIAQASALMATLYKR